MKENILTLLQSKSDEDLFKGLKLLIEAAKKEPSSLDPILLALIARVVKPVCRETILGIQFEKFHGNA